MIEETAERDGLPMSLDRIKRTPNTLAAHRLVRFASRVQLADRMTDLLFAAYFVESLDIGDREVLLAKAAEAGLDPDLVRDHLAGNADVAAIRATESVARQIGIQAVPCFIFNRRYALAGAQEPSAFMPLLDLAAEEVTPLPHRVMRPA